VFEIEADVFRVGFSGMAGGSFVPVFQIANVGGVAKLAIRGDMLFDGAITAGKIAAGAIDASSILAGNIIVTGHLVADAATAVAYAAASDLAYTITSTTETDIVSVALTTTVGDVMIDAWFYMRDNLVGVPDNTITVNLKIDNVTVKSLVVVAQSDTNPSSKVYLGAWKGTFPLLHLASGLGNASHTFKITVTGNAGNSSGTVTLRGPAIRVMESRR
jgi:hypothetical protein